MCIFNDDIFPLGFALGDGDIALGGSLEGCPGGHLSSDLALTLSVFLLLQTVGLHYLLNHLSQTGAKQQGHQWRNQGGGGGILR